MRSVKSIIGDRDTITVERGASVTAAAVIMATHKIGALAVVDDGRLVGIFTERDVLTRVVAERRNPDATAVSDVMSTNLIVAELKESYDLCLARMQQAHVRHLVVLDSANGGRLAGILSLRDILAADIDEKAQELTMLNAYVHFIPTQLP